MRSTQRKVFIVALAAVAAAACSDNPAVTEKRDPTGVFTVTSRAEQSQAGVVAPKQAGEPRRLVGPCYIDVGCPEEERPLADFDYGAYATFLRNQSDPVWGYVKVLRLGAWSQSYANVRHHSINASFQSVQASSGSYCNNTPSEFGTSSLTTVGNPYYTIGNPYYLEVAWEVTWPDQMKWRVEGEHTFTPKIGYSGGTFYSAAVYCG